MLRIHGDKHLLLRQDEIIIQRAQIVLDKDPSITFQTIGRTSVSNENFAALRTDGDILRKTDHPFQLEWTHDVYGSLRILIDLQQPQTSIVLDQPERREMVQRSFAHRLALEPSAMIVDAKTETRLFVTEADLFPSRAEWRRVQWLERDVKASSVPTPGSSIARTDVQALGESGMVLPFQRKIEAIRMNFRVEDVMITGANVQIFR